MPSRPRASARTRTSASGRSSVPDHRVIGSPVPSTPAGTVPRRTRGATRATARRAGASSVSAVWAEPQARPRTSARTATATSGHAEPHQGRAGATGVQQRELPGLGRDAAPLGQPRPGDHDGPRGLAGPREPGREHGDRNERDDEGVRANPERRTASSSARTTTGARRTGANAPRTTTRRPWRTRSSPWNGGSRAATGRHAIGGRSTRATTAPRRPWATAAEATPVVAQAKAASPRTHRVGTTGRRERYALDGRERHPEDMTSATTRPAGDAGLGRSGTWSTSQAGSASSPPAGPTGSGPPRPAPVQPSVHDDHRRWRRRGCRPARRRPGRSRRR